jgi:hypothetical protein
MPTKTDSSLRNQTIENYIQRVTELSQLGQKIPTAHELNNIASELGITEAEILSAKKQSEAHFIRAQGYCNLNHWNDAIEELQEAVAFNPLNLEMLHLLALAHFGRWRNQHQRQDEQQMKMRIKQCLEIQPDHQASLKLLADLDQAIRQRQYQLMAIASLVSIAVGSIIGYFWLNNLTFNLFARKNVELENLRTEFQQKIEQIQQEKQILVNQLTEEFQQKNQDNQTKIGQLNSQVQELQSQLQNLNRQNQYLQDKLTKIEEKHNHLYLPNNQVKP